MFNNYLEEGYYEDNGYNLTKINDPIKIIKLQKERRLYFNNGIATNFVYEDEKLYLENLKKLYLYKIF